MRIAVDCRFLSLGPALMSRGIPRYIRQQLRAVLAHDRDNQYLLMHRAQDDVSALPAEVRDAPNVTLAPFPGEAAKYARMERTLHATEELERWLLRERIDLFHATAPWLPITMVLPRIDACPVVTTIYDTIPTLFQEHLHGLMKDGWVVAVEQLRRSTRLIAISEHTARDATLYYEIPPERLDVAYPHADPFFQPLAPGVAEARLAPLRRQLGLAGPFTVTVSFPGYRNKNIETLLEAYRILPAPVRSALPLVVVGAQGPTSEALRDVCRRMGILPHVFMTGVISDDEICALYNAATLVVCPSRYEGFGMPVVEAMQCGTPVLTSNAASLPEAAGDAAWLVDAEDAPAFAHAIATLAGDDARRAEMRRRGLEQVRRFTSEGLGRATLDAYRRTVASSAAADAPVSVTTGTHVAPVTRIAVCIANPVARDPRLRAQIETADALSSGAEVDLFFEGDGTPACELLRRFRLHDSAALDRIHAARPYDAILRAPAASEPAAAWRAATKARGEIAIAPAAPLTGVADPLGPQPLLQREQARTYLELSTTSFVVACPEIGGTAADWQMLVLAFADLFEVCPHAWLFVACDPKTNAAPVALIQHAKPFGLHERIRAQALAAPGTAPTAAASAEDLYLAAADVVVAIAGAGRAAAPHVVMRALAAGKPAIVDDSETWAWAPDDACVRVPAASFGFALGQTLRALCSDPLRRAAMGAAGRAAYEREWTLAHLRTRLRAALDLPALPDSPVVPDAGEPRSAPGLGFNRVCNIEDFRDQELVAEMHEVLPYKVRHFGPRFPHRVEHCKDWEVAMATRTLRQFGALRPDASILGVAAGMEDTIFYLSKHVGEVMTVDRYVQSGVWQLNSPLWMLVTPEWGAPDGCNQDRIVIQHMDARRLRFPDNRFDGIFSSGSIEHFGGLMEVAHSAYEMGRVLKPGGILSLSTVMAIAGPPGRLGGVPGTCLLFQREHLLRYIVEASGLELVDALDTTATPATHAVHRSLEEVLTSVALNSSAQGLKGLQEDFKHGVFPCLALDWEGFTFDSVHLALRKPLSGWGAANAWAQPTPEVETRIREDYRRVIEDYGAWAPTSTTLSAPVDSLDIARRQARRVNTRILRHHVVTLASDLDGLRSEVERHARQTPALAVGAEAEDGTSSGLPATWVPIPLHTPNVPPYVLLVDRTEKRDILVDAYLRGMGAAINGVEFALIRLFVKPGDAVIDAGAHLGSITLPLAASGCRVLAVEASSKNARLLRASVAYNGFRDVTVVHAAAAAAEGSLSFYSDGAWGWVVPPGEAATEVVPAVRLDDLAGELGWTRVAAIKIDIEGGELAAIAGLERILSRSDAPALYYESNLHTHHHAGTSAGQVVAALEAHGYRNYAVTAGRLTRVRPGDQQKEIVRDHLAVKGPLPPMPPPITIDEGRV